MSPLQPAFHAPRVPARGAGLALALTLALAPTCGGDAPAETTPPVARTAAADARFEAFDAARAWAHLVRQVEIGPRPAGSAGAELCRQFIEGQLETIGLEPVRQTFQVDPPPSTQLARTTLTNLVVRIAGASQEAESRPLVIVGCHYDTKRWTADSGLAGHVLGANDGASGVAVLLELARLLRARTAPTVDYELVFFDGEEAFRWEWSGRDNRYGSRHHAQSLRASGELERVAAMVNVDMIGDANLELSRDSNSDRELLGMFWAAATDRGLARHVQQRGSLAISDDHLSYLELGVPSADLIDLHYPDASNRYWHSDDDTLEHVSQSSLEAAGRILTGGLGRLEQKLESAR